MKYKEECSVADEQALNELDYWKSYTYDVREEVFQADVEFLKKLLGSRTKKVLEIACGSGRICIPLAKQGHDVVGVDISKGMLDVLKGKLINEKLPNLKVFQADALLMELGNGFDCVILAGNLMMNIIPSYSYKKSQDLFIKKASQAINKDGMVYIDFSLWSDPTKIFNTDKSLYMNKQKVIYEADDNHGNHGTYYGLGSYYSPKTHINKQRNKIVVTLKNGMTIEKYIGCDEHIPDLEFIHGLIKKNGLKVVAEYGDYKKNPISEKTDRAIIIAKKV